MDNNAFWLLTITGLIGLITGIQCLRARRKLDELEFEGYLATAFGAYILLPVSFIILIVGIFYT